MQENATLDLASVRARLQGARGKDYWRSLEEVAETPEFAEFLHREFPDKASEWLDPVTRRSFLRLMGASLAMAGISGCITQPLETIVPYVQAPEHLVPGKPLFFATAFTLGGFARGILAESHMGRPTKLEGNPGHPASLGSTDRFTQAAVLDLYDPDRSQIVTHQGQVATWTGFLAAVGAALSAQKPLQGAGVRILTETVTSPTLRHQLEQFLEKYPKARWHQYEPVATDSARAGIAQAFGRRLNPIYRFDRARIVVSLDADFLVNGPAGIRHARDFSARRQAQAEGKDSVRLYVVESALSTTGSVADHRLPMKASRIEPFARALAQALGVEAGGPAPAPDSVEARWLTAIVEDLKDPANQGATLLLAGDGQPPAVHALAHALNQALGNIGTTVVYTEPVDPGPASQMDSLRELTADLDAGRVELLLVLGGNPVYTAPADLKFSEAIVKVKFRAHLALHEDETSALCQWHLPEAHFLEAWGDARAFDGSVTLQQPLIAPIYEGKSALEVTAALLGEAGRPGHDVLRRYWQQQRPAAGFEAFWATSVHDGQVAGTAFAEVQPPPAAPIPPATPPPATAPGELEVLFRPDPTIWDGRFSNNAWLQELPKPLTTLTWDNTAHVAPALAERLGLASGDVVELTLNGLSLRAPVWVMPGQADETVTLHLGYGRTRAGRVGTGLGFDASAIRASTAPWAASGAKLVRTGLTHALAPVQTHHNMEGRDLIRTLLLGETPERHEESEPKESMYPGHKYEGYAWGMTIDLNSCIGCNGCVVACQAENNIPVVGKDQVARGREMHWLRVDRYFKGDLDNPETFHQPVPCMHCENAPCEVVCPVAATSHSDEGLNDMTYNRCVGTRYCSNNCPYKVRRFNFLQYADYETPSLKLAANPNVTVRTRGVMEKCTYCVQRINAARIASETEGRPIQDGEVVTACQAACPAQAIVFGNVNDPLSRVSKLKAEQRNYSLLGELNTRPRTTYLSVVRNPSKHLKEGIG